MDLKGRGLNSTWKRLPVTKPWHVSNAIIPVDFASRVRGADFTAPVLSQPKLLRAWAGWREAALVDYARTPARAGTVAQRPVGLANSCQDPGFAVCAAGNAARNALMRIAA